MATRIVPPSARAAAKKARERHALTAAQELDGHFPRVSFRDGKEGAEPDFVLTLPDGTLGVEIVECFSPDLHRGLSRNAQETFTFKVADKVKTECLRIGISHLSAHLTFDFSVRLRNEEIAPLAKEIVELIKPCGDPSTPRLRFVRRRQLPSAIKEISAHHRPTIPEPFIGLASGVPPAAPFDERQLRELLKGKNEKFFRIYQLSCSKTWLLVVVDQYRVACQTYIPPDLRLTESPFDRVIVLQGWSDTLEIWKAPS
jgi:hypothetical protein